VTSHAFIVTPEHVRIRLEPAGLGSRFLAVVTDFVILVAVGTLLSLVFTTLLPRSVAGLLSVTSMAMLGWGYHVYFEIRHAGRTPGKRMAGLRVVDGRGLPLQPAQSFVRNVARVLDFLPFGYGVGAIASLVDDHHRRLGDVAAGTLVVKERPATLALPRLPRSPRWNSLATPRTRKLLERRLGLEDRELLLELVLRAEQLDAASRFDVMEEAGRIFRERLEIEDEALSGESLLRDLCALTHGSDEREG